MNIDEFREEFKEISVYEGEWKKYMEMAVNLFKSLGLKTKDVKDDSALQVSYFYVSELLENILHPDMQDFYRYINTLNECSNPSRIKEVLNSEKVRDLIFGLKKKKEVDENVDNFMEELYESIGSIISSKLIRNTSFLSDCIKVHGQKYKDLYNGGLSLNISGIKDELYEFYLNSPDYKKFVEKSFVEEMKRTAKEAEKIMKEGLTYRILVITDFFNKTGYLEEIVETNNSIMQKRGLEPLMVSMQDEKGKFNVMNLLNPEYFKQFTMEELFLFAAHYTNRFEKKVDDLSIGVFLHKKLGTFYDMVEYGELPSKISLDDVKLALRQKAFLDKKAEEKFKEFKTAEDVDDIDLSEVPAEYIKDYAEVYQKYFNMYLPKNSEENDFVKDYRFIFLNQGLLHCLYEIKGFSLKSVLYTLAQSNSKFNYGIIKEERKIRNKYGEKQLGLGIDYKGCTPLRLHYPEKDVIQFVKEFFDGKELRNYIGNEDFNINGNEIRTHLFYKYTKDQNKGIKKLYESLTEKSPIFKFVRHIYENMHPSQNPLNTKKEDRKYKPQKSGNNDFDNR